MKKWINKVKTGLFLALTAAFILTGCATSQKHNPWMAKRKKASHVSTTQLGRNKYYFSTSYQKKLWKNVKKRR
jgi:outer membrane biogenesis lipoprotein LolB